LIALIDGDIFRYRCGFAAERSSYLVELTNTNGHKEFKEFDYKKEADAYSDRVTSGVSASTRTWTRKEIQPIENCLQIAKASLSQTLNDIQNKFNAEVEYRIYLSGQSNFRQAVAVTKPYKGNRDKSSKPTHHEELGVYLTKQWNAIVTDGIEADDAIGIAAMEAKTKGTEYIVVSNDKDLHQIPGKHYDWVKKEFYEVSPKEAKTNFFIQVLAGDSTDNIPGLPGVGKVTAEKILAECKTPQEMVETVWKEYAKEHDSHYFREQAELVYILRKQGETWFDTKEGYYWEDRYGVPQ
jgi:hypothetical protein